MNLSRESGLHRAALRARKALDELRREGVIDIAQAALAKDQLAAMKPFATPRRPEALHLALRYERLVREGKVRAPRTSIPHSRQRRPWLQEQVTRLARRYLNSFRAPAQGRSPSWSRSAGSLRELQRHSREVGSARFDGATAAQLQTAPLTTSPAQLQTAPLETSAAQLQTAPLETSAAQLQTAPLETSAAQLQTAPLETSAALLTSRA